MKERARRTARKEASFEEALEALERIVERLETGDLPLEESLALFEEGVQLTRVCSDRLQAAEKKIEVLLRDESGAVRVQAGDPAEYVQGEDDGQGEAPAG